MNALLKKRPTAVTVIGWICIAGTILMILSGVMGSAVISFIQHMGGQKPCRG